MKLNILLEDDMSHEDIMDVLELIKKKFERTYEVEIDKEVPRLIFYIASTKDFPFDDDDRVGEDFAVKVGRVAGNWAIMSKVPNGTTPQSRGRTNIIEVDEDGKIIPQLEQILPKLVKDLKRLEADNHWKIEWCDNHEA
jgi:hypothetical protein